MDDKRIILRVGKYHSVFYGRNFFGSISIIAHTQLMVDFEAEVFVHFLSKVLIA